MTPAHRRLPLPPLALLLALSAACGSSPPQPEELGNRRWQYTISNHGPYDIRVWHEQVVESEWCDGSNPWTLASGPPLLDGPGRAGEPVAAGGMVSVEFCDASRRGTARIRVAGFVPGADAPSFTQVFAAFPMTRQAIDVGDLTEIHADLLGPVRLVWVNEANRTNATLNVLVRPAAADGTWIGGTNWMSAIDGRRTLAEIAIPGSHDSASCDGTEWFRLACDTQSSHVEQQLASGVRSFDVRMWCVDGQLYLRHGDTKAYCIYGLVDDVLATFRTFLRDHPTETLLVHPMKEANPRNCGTYGNDTGQALRAALGMAQLEGLVVMRDLDRIPTLEAARGKVVLLPDPDVASCCPWTPPLTWAGNTLRDVVQWTPDATFVVEDEYLHTDDVYRSGNRERKWSTAVQPMLLEASRSRDPQAMYYVYTSGYTIYSTLWGPIPFPAQMGSYVNVRVADWLSTSPSLRLRGVTIMDFVNCGNFATRDGLDVCNDSYSEALPLLVYAPNFAGW